MMIAKINIEAKFKRAKVSSKRTWIWVEMPKDLKEEVQLRVQLLDNEYNMICFYKNIEYILLLTTQRLIVIRDNTVENYFYTSIIDVKLNEIFNDETTKTSNDIINVILKSGKQINVVVEKGTWHILYNIIKLIISQENKT